MSWSLLGASGTSLGASRGILKLPGASPARERKHPFRIFVWDPPLEDLWGRLGHIQGRRGRWESESGGYAKVYCFRTEWGAFLFLGAAWGLPGVLRGVREAGSWGRFGASWWPLAASSALLGRLLGASWSLLGPQGRRDPDVRYNTLSGSLLGAVLGDSWAVFGALWAVFERSWGVLEPSCEPLWLCWSDLGGLLGRRGASASRKGGNPKKV